MAEITAALDEVGANKLLDIAIASLPTLTNGGSGSLGPFTVSYFVKANLTSGNVDLIPPDTIRIADLRLDWHIDFTLLIDLRSEEHTSELQSQFHLVCRLLLE